MGVHSAHLLSSSVTISARPQRAARCSGKPSAALTALTSAPAPTSTLAHSSRCASAALAACARAGTHAEGGVGARLHGYG